MMHNAWCRIEKVPCCFPRSSIKFQGHTGWKIDDLNPNFVITRPVAAIKSLRFALLSLLFFCFFSHTAAWTKWPTFCRWHFQVYFLEWKNIDQNSIKFVPKGPIGNKSIILIMAWHQTGDRSQYHDDVIKWDNFPRYWPFVRGIHRSRWIPRTMASDDELWCFLWSASE